MVRLSVTKNGGLTIFMVGMVAASISMMEIVIFACAKSSTKRKNENNKNIVIGESNYKAEKTRATSAPVCSTGEIQDSAEEITTVVDIPSTNDGGKDTRCHGGDTTKSNGGNDGSKINDVSIDRNDNNYVSGDNNNNMGGGHTHASASSSTSGGGGHHHGDTSGNTGGGGGWSNDHGGSSWGGGHHHGGGGFSGGGGGFSGGDW